MEQRFAQQLKKGVLEMLVLELICQKPSYGYALLLALKERSEGMFQLKEGTLYPILYRLEDEGMIQSSWSAGEGRSAPKKIYTATQLGQKQRLSQRQYWKDFTKTVEEFYRRTIYLDVTQEQEAVGIVADPGVKVVHVGTTVHREPEELRGHPKAQKWEQDWDLHFLYGADPGPELYTIPRTEVVGFDGQGGWILVTDDVSFEEDNCYYLSRDRAVFHILGGLERDPSTGQTWQERLVPWKGIRVFSSKEEAMTQERILTGVHEFLQQGDL